MSDDDYVDEHDADDEEEPLPKVETIAERIGKEQGQESK